MDDLYEQLVHSILAQRMRELAERDGLDITVELVPEDDELVSYDPSRRAADLEKLARWRGDKPQE